MPFQFGLEMQRQSIKSTQQVFEQSLELQGEIAETMLHNSFAAQRDIQDQMMELAQATAKEQFEAVEEMSDDVEREIRSGMNDQFRRNANLIQQLLNDQFEQGADFVQQLLNAQLDAFQSAFEAEQFDGRSLIDRQFGALADSRDIFYSEFEPEFVTAIDQLTEQQRTMVAESTDAFLDAHDQLQSQTINGLELPENTN